MRNKIYILLIIAILLIPNEAKSQLFPSLGNQRIGISTAQFLKIPVDARASSLGETYVAVANDISSTFWNPAGLIQSPGNQIMFSNNNWLADIRHQFFAASYKLSENDIIGASFIALTMDDMPVTTEFNPFGTGEYFRVQDLCFGFTYSRRMTDKFSFGFTIKYVNQILAKLTANSFLIDLGTYYWTGLGTSRFAVAVANFGGDIAPDGEVRLVSGQKKKSWQAFSPPTFFRFGLAFEPYMDEINILTFSAQLNHPNDNRENVSLGIEYGWNKIIFLRSGYKINVDQQNYSIGAGVKYRIYIADFSFDYSFSSFERLGPIHRFTIILGF